MNNSITLRLTSSCNGKVSTRTVLFEFTGQVAFGRDEVVIALEITGLVGDPRVIVESVEPDYSHESENIVKGADDLDSLAGELANWLRDHASSSSENN